MRSINQKKKKILVFSLLLIALMTASSIAAIYLYRQANLNITVNDYTQATGRAMFGFYEGGNNYLIEFHAPNGTTTYDTNKLYVYFNGITAISDDGATQIKMYSTATVEATITQGGWIFENLLNFGSDTHAGQNHITLKVKTPSQASQAELRVYWIEKDTTTGVTTTHYMGALDLTDPNGELALPGHSWTGTNILDGYTTDLIVTYDQPVSDSFSVSIYETTN
ncbi:MAG: hypothetical protein GSR79_08850 [Desulfurococcales archaeon]|nr:hypothetical protein [Desulfurococcales archaeon]